MNKYDILVLTFLKTFLKFKLLRNINQKNLRPMAKEKKPINPFSTKKWKKFQAPQSLSDLLQTDGEYTVHYGKIDGETSFFMVGKFGRELYAYAISVDNLTQLEKLRNRLDNLRCEFRENADVNPFRGWEKCPLNQSIPNNVVKLFGEGNRRFYVGRHGDSCYRFLASHRNSGRELDWVQNLGVVARI